MKQYEIGEKSVNILAEEMDIGADITWGQNVSIEARQVIIGSSATIGSNVRIKGEYIFIATRAQIQDDVSISSSYFSLGYRSRVETRCQISGMGTPSAEHIVIGDVSLLASDCRVFIPVLKVGDYVKIHNHTLINGRKACVIGHNSGIFQNNILNGEDTLIIGNHVGLGIYTSVWTHAYFGDLLEGCNTFEVSPTFIGDDVWVVGAYNVIAPGVHIGDKAMVLTHSYVNKDVPSNHCVAGIPAKDITNKIKPFRVISLDEKFSMMFTYIEDFLRIQYPRSFITTSGGFHILRDTRQFKVIFMDIAYDEQIGEDVEKLIITKENCTRQDYKRVTIFDLNRREYTKRLTDPEVELIYFLLSYRARFTPAGHQKMEL